MGVQECLVDFKFSNAFRPLSAVSLTSIFVAIDTFLLVETALKLHIILRNMRIFRGAIVFSNRKREQGVRQRCQQWILPMHFGKQQKVLYCFLSYIKL